MIPVIEDRIQLPTKRDVLRLLLYTKLLEKGIEFSDSELDVLMELHTIGGYYDTDKEAEFFNNCITQKYRTSHQSIRNVLTKFVNAGVIRKPSIHQRYVSEDYLPQIDSEIVGLNFLVHNAI